MTIAAIHDRVTTVQALLDGRVDVNCTPVCGQTALHFAAHSGCKDVVDELLVRGADVSRVDLRKRKTPAEWAVEGGFPELANLLEKRRA